MIGVTFNGRLGNQLFQFYFFLYLKSRNRNKFFFFVNPHHSYITRYFNLGRYNLLIGSKVGSLFARSLPKVLRFENLYPQNFVAPRAFEVRNRTIYNGYFQSDWYLEHSKEKVNISVKKKYVKQFRALYGDIFEEHKTVAVHIRRTDYLHYGKRDISLPISYFKKQLASIENLSTYKVIFLSDEIDFVKEAFPKEDNFIYSTNNEIVDFQIIQHADIAIISNSSFAWWPAYLSP